MTRPLLIPGLPRLWRAPGELQLGADPSRAVSVQLPEPRAALLLDLLDGTRSERAVLVRAAELDIPSGQARALLDTLRAAGLVRSATELIPSGLPHESRRRLVGEAAALALARPQPTTAPADILRRRWHSRVVINGHGRLGAPIAVALAEAGIGRIEAEVPGLVGPGELAGGPLRGADLGRPRREAISDAVLRAAPGLRSPGVRRPAAPSPAAPPPTAPPPAAALHNAGPAVSSPDAPLPDAALPDAALPDAALPDATPIAATTRTASLAAATSPGATLVVRLDRDGPPDPLGDRRPYLAVTIREGTPVIGPLVPAAGGTCLRCIDLHRTDRDATWPGPAPRPRAEPAEPCTVVTLLAATAYATSEILAHLDGGEPETLGAAVEIAGPGRARRRSWPPHPACLCANRVDLSAR